MDTEYLAEIKAREQAATPGPWKVGISALITDANGHALFFGEDAKGNADFIAHARTDIPALVAEVERLKAESEEWRNAYIRMKEDWKHDCDLLVQAGTENATLKKALKIAIRRAYPHASPDTVKAAAACLIEEAREQEAATC